MGVLVDYAHLSNDCAAKAAFTRTAIKEKKKSRALRFKGQWHSGSKMSFHTSGSFCAFH